MVKYSGYFARLLVVSFIVYTPATTEEPSHQAVKATCDRDSPCQNAGTCFEGVCRCSKDFTGSLCETPTWCSNGKCGYMEDVECVWDRYQRRGECRCKKDGHYYLAKNRKCYKCECGIHGECVVVNQMAVCKCNENYAMKSSKCEYCDCGRGSDQCSFNSRAKKICQCRKGFAPKNSLWPDDVSCESCDCGDHGKCRFEGQEKICDCEHGYRLFGGKCKECNCGEAGICELDENGEKVCTCDFTFADDSGFCKICDCHPARRRVIGINCTFDNGEKQCECPPGYATMSEYCSDIDECSTSNPCPANSICINKPGTFECQCKAGYKTTYPWLDPKKSGCQDIDECLDHPCVSSTTRCVNSPGSFDCVCQDGYYATSGNYGSTYKPAYNNCYETETQWREATIALGVLLSIEIIWIVYYIKRHKRSS